MRARRIRKNNHPGQNLDSFLDIMTNTIGVLMFVSIFVSLLTAEAGTVIRTPLRSETSKVGKFFEIRNNQVFYLSDSKLQTEIDKIVATLPTCKSPEVPKNIPSYLYSFYIQEVEQYEQCIKTRNIKLENFYYNNGNYLVSFTDQGSLKYDASSSSQGEDSKQLKNTNSNFINTLKNLNPEINYVAFIVRPDSFEAFRVAREKAWSLGFDVGWEPISQDRVFVFGSGGRSIGIQ
jgi:hypothetical protein